MKNNIVKGASILTVVLMFGMMMTPVLGGAPVQPHNRWGQAYDGAGQMPAGETLTVWIDGTSYGTIDTLASGWFSLDCLGDGDNPSTTPDNVKIGGYIGDTMMYVHGDLTSAGTFFDVLQMDTWAVGGVTNGDLTYNAVQPALLKINCVSVAPLNQPIPYIGIYDPGATVLTDYGLDIGDSGAFVPLNMGDVIGVIGAITYFNAGPYGGLAAANSIQIAHLATGFVVDRVEYGGIGAEPENTNMPDAPSPAAGEEIYRIPAPGADTNDCAVDFGVQPDHVFGTTATATGPISIPPTPINVVDITYIWGGPVVSVDIYYSVDDNVTWNVLANDATVEGVYAGVDLDLLAGPNLYWWICNAAPPGDDAVGIPAGGTPAEAGPYNYQIGGIPPQVNDLMAYGHNPGAADIHLEWNEQAGSLSYNIYRSMAVDGTGFNFAVPYDNVVNVAGLNVYDDTGAYGDANDYAWVVRSVGAGGENTTDLDNIAFKRVVNMFTGAGSFSTTDNYIALPYRTEFALAADLITDMRNYGVPGLSVSSVNRWNQDTSAWESRSPFAGINFPITAGEAYRAVVTAANIEWKMVGAYDSTVFYDLFTGAGPFSTTDNYVALPYHANLNVAADLIGSMRNDGVPGLSVSSVNRWNQDTSAWESRSPFAGINFPITPGEGYRAVVTAPSVIWTCPVVVPGP